MKFKKLHPIYLHQGGKSAALKVVMKKRIATLDSQIIV
jgi:hypothetical protein